MFSAPQKATLIACIVLAVLTGALVASPVAATQEAPNNTTTNTPTTTAEEDTRNVSIQVDPTTYVASYEYRNGEFRVTLVSSVPKTVTISEAVGGEKGGTGYFNVRQVRLMPNEPTTVTIPAEQTDGKSVVTLTTSLCIEQGKCPYIQAGSGEALLFDGAAEWNYVYLAATLTFAGGAYGTRRYIRRNETDDDDRMVSGVFDDE